MSIGTLAPEELMRGHNPQFADAAIVDARRRKQFLQGHIPGAVWMGWEAWCEPAPSHAGPTLAQEGYWGVLAEATMEEYAQRLALSGLRLDQPIVVYADGPRTRGREGRIAWMLLYLGATSVYLLDGGWSAWLDRNGEVEHDTPQRPPVRCSIALERRRRIVLEQVHQAVTTRAGSVLVDVRSQAEFDGEIQEYLPRRGRLPGARLVPFADLFESTGRYTERDEYLARLPQQVQQAADLIAYCEVGVRASLFALLHEIHTGTMVPVFDGSLMQWSLARELPMEGRE